MNEKQLISKAKMYGHKAKRENKPRVPAYDEKAMNLITTDGSAVIVLKAWLEGWDETHQQATDRVLKELGF
jgi:hypothetical protein